MTADRDIEHLLDAWLADGPMQVSDHVFDEAVGRVHRQRQRPAWRFLWRKPLVITPLKVALGAAAVIVVFVAGFAMFGPSGTQVGGVAPPTATPTVPPTPTASPSSSPTPVYVLPGGTLKAGTYVTRPFDGSGLLTRFTFTLPDGWSGFPNWGLLGPEGTGSTGGIGIGFLTAEGLFSDPCHWDAKGDGSFPQQGDIAVGPTVDDLVAALVAHPGYTATAPTDVVVSGYAGKRVDLQLPANIDLSKCDKVGANPDGVYFVWGTSDPGGNDLYLQGPGQRWQLRILDVAGGRVVIVVDDYANTSAQDRAQAQQIIDSLQITPN